LKIFTVMSRKRRTPNLRRDVEGRASADSTNLFDDQAPSLLVKRLHIGSPFDMELLVQRGVWVSNHQQSVLLYRVMRKPKQLGAWLPRVLAGWLEGMQEVDEVKRLRKEYEIGAKSAESLNSSHKLIL
jgi:hypothetical protein